MTGHKAPIMIKLFSFFLSHIFEVIMWVHLVSNTFFHYLSTLVIQHPFMACLLKTSCSIIIHLLSFNYLITVSNGSCNFILIFFLNRTAIWTEFCRTHKSLLDEMPLTWARTWRSHHHVRIHHPVHILSHVLHHGINSSKALISKKRIIPERISATKGHH